MAATISVLRGWPFAGMPSPPPWAPLFACLTASSWSRSSFSAASTWSSFSSTAMISRLHHVSPPCSGGCLHWWRRASYMQRTSPPSSPSARVCCLSRRTYELRQPSGLPL